MRRSPPWPNLVRVGFRRIRADRCLLDLLHVADALRETTESARGQGRAPLFARFNIDDGPSSAVFTSPGWAQSRVSLAPRAQAPQISIQFPRSRLELFR